MRERLWIWGQSVPWPPLLFPRLCPPPFTALEAFSVAWAMGSVHSVHHWTRPLLPNKVSASIGNLERVNALVGRGEGFSAVPWPWEPREAVGSAVCLHVERRGLDVCIPPNSRVGGGALGGKVGQEGEPLRWE